MNTPPNFPNQVQLFAIPAGYAAIVGTLLPFGGDGKATVCFTIPTKSGGTFKEYAVYIGDPLHAQQPAAPYKLSFTADNAEEITAQVVAHGIHVGMHVFALAQVQSRKGKDPQKPFISHALVKLLPYSKGVAEYGVQTLINQPAA